MSSFAIWQPLATLALRRGGVIAYPTEGVWGLGCDPADPEAVQSLLAIKDRPLHKGLILIGSHIDQLKPWIGNLDDLAMQRIKASRGKGITWVVPHHGRAPAWITGSKPTVAIRLTAHPVAATLCDLFDGALVSTSANPSSKPPALNALQVRRYFGGLIDVIVPGALGGQNGPSEIRDLLSGEMLRPAPKP